MKNIKIKETYLLFLIVMGLISLSVYSTYALFTASTTINNVVGITASLTTNSAILEYEMMEVPAGTTKIIEVTVKNSYSQTLYYGAWYEILDGRTADFSMGLYTEKDNTGNTGQISAGGSATLLVGIRNCGDAPLLLNVGTVGSTTSSLGLSSPRTLIPTGWINEGCSSPEKTLASLGLESSLKTGTPDFSKISPLTTYTQNIANNQTVSLTDSTNTIRLGSTISFNSSTGKFTLGSTTANQTYGTSAVGKYTCASSSSSCTTAYKIRSVNVGDSDISWDESGSDSVEPACDLEDGTSIYYGSTIVASGSGYKLSGVISSFDTYNLYDDPTNAHNTGWSCCSTSSSTVCQEGELFNVEWYEPVDHESGTLYGFFPKDIVVVNATNEVTKADIYTSISSLDTSDTGIFASTDDIGNSYYFRGNVTNNYVYFAGFYWRIIRINGDGTIRMIYDGTSAYDNGTSNSDRVAGSAYFNEYLNDNLEGDNTYVGYMYGPEGATTYAATHSNTSDSSVKVALDNWYKTNIYDKGYSAAVADAIYCNDRSLDTGTGIGATTTYYKARNRLSTNKLPSLLCGQQSDRFTKGTAVSGVAGNGKLASKYPVGLITADEVAMAGETFTTTNTKGYMYVGSAYWTMTPYRMYSSVASMLTYGTKITYRATDSNTAFRPVITLKSDAITGGSGTKTSPFST